MPFKPFVPARLLLIAALFAGCGSNEQSAKPAKPAKPAKKEELKLPYPGAKEYERIQGVDKFSEIDQQTLALRHKQPIFYCGVPMRQIPTDNWLMAELIQKIKPDFVVETGTLFGGSALFYASVLERVNPDGIVITVDINKEQIYKEATDHDLWKRRIKFVHGGSTDDAVLTKVREIIGDGDKTVLVTLDTLHAPKHVTDELRLYGPLVSKGSYMILQDTFFEGLLETVDEFLKVNPDFESDATMDTRFGLTKHRGGFLKRNQD